MVNRSWGPEEGQVPERHSAADFAGSLDQGLVGGEGDVAGHGHLRVDVTRFYDTGLLSCYINTRKVIWAPK